MTRWGRTIDEAPHMFSTREHADTDWALYCGGWLVGRILENLRPVEPRVVASHAASAFRWRGAAPAQVRRA